MTHLVVCSDCQGIPALHTCLLTAKESTRNLHIHLLENGLTPGDLDLLRETLGDTPLTTHRVDLSGFENLPKMVGSVAPYFRLLAPALVRADRFVYLDTDILVGRPLDEIAGFELDGHPAAMVPETTAIGCGDRTFLTAAKTDSHAHYFNSGVMLVDTKVWRDQEITARCLQFLEEHPADYWDQTALNIVLGASCPALPHHFNVISNDRKNWPLVLKDNVLHLVDRPKPWDRLGKWIHPQAHLWWPAFRRTALAGRCPVPPISTGGKIGYKKAAKDHLLTLALRTGLVRRVKGMQ